MFNQYSVAVVTGATRGIGKATAFALRRRGMTVFAVSRNKAALDERASAGVIPVQADVRDTACITRILEGVELDVLVNNVRVLLVRAPIHETQPSEIDEMIDVNLKAPMHLTRALVRGMIRRRRGHLVYIGSSGQAPTPTWGCTVRRKRASICSAITCAATFSGPL